MTDLSSPAAAAPEPAAEAGSDRERPPKLVHLIHVGYPKTGSKSLQHWFERHPQIAFTQWGIAGAADAFGFVSRFAPGTDTRCAVTSYEGLVTPSRDQQDSDFDDVESLLPRREWITRIAETLASLFREPRILIVTRGFRDLCLSYYAEAVALGCTLEFEEFCSRFFLVRDPERDVVNYDFIIGLYERLFGAPNVVVLPYELLRQDADAFIRPIEAAAGVGRAISPPAWLHRSFSPEELYLYPRLGRLLQSLPVGAALRKWLHRRYLESLRGRRARILLRLLKRIWTVRPVDRDAVPDAVVERFRGSAESLRERRFYRGLEPLYLL